MALIVVALSLVAGWLLVMPVAERRARRIGSLGPPPAPTRDLLDRLRAIAGRIGVGPASRRRRAAERVRVIQALGALAAELEAGQAPDEALRRSCGEPPVWPTALAALQLDGDVPAALEDDASTAPVLRQLSACWRVAADSGAGLASAIGRLAESARQAENVRVDLEGQLAAPRATARMLAGLPIIGIGFGVMLGADPITWLVATTVGRACLVGGALLTVVGMWWTGRIAASVERLL